jgi:plastocyanin
MTIRMLRIRAIQIVIATVMALQINSARGEDHMITIDNFTFEPRELAIKPGTTVRWTNRDDIPHTIVSPGSFKSKALDTDDSFAFVFDHPGTYNYFCSLHPHMTGMIKVE